MFASPSSLQGYTVVYGGSFDPPHVCHQMTCLYLLEALGADEVWVVPAYAHPFGKLLGDFQHRFNMCQLMCQVFGSRSQVLDVEKDLDGRTYHTLLHLSQRYPDRRFALSIGADIAEETHRWFRWQEICQQFPVVVMGRHGYPSLGSKVDLPAVCSSVLRDMLKTKQNIAGFIGGNVLQYIEDHRLYTTND